MQTGRELALTFEAAQVRVIMRGEDPWWVLVDVCAVLDLANPRDVASRLDPDEKDAVGITDAIGRLQSTIIVSEPGLYAVLGRSSKPKAKRFDRWVRHEVLPSIRKTGTYTLPGNEVMPIPADFRAVIREEVAPIHQNVVDIRTGLEYVTKRLDETLPRGKAFSDINQWAFRQTLLLRNEGRCLVSRELIVDPAGNAIDDLCHIDHFHGPANNKIIDGWAVFWKVNLQLRDSAFRDKQEPRFRAFQLDLHDLIAQGLMRRYRHQAQKDLFD